MYATALPSLFVKLAMATCIRGARWNFTIENTSVRTEWTSISSNGEFLLFRKYDMIVSFFHIWAANSPLSFFLHLILCYQTFLILILHAFIKKSVFHSVFLKPVYNVLLFSLSPLFNVANAIGCNCAVEREI